MRSRLRILVGGLSIIRLRDVELLELGRGSEFRFGEPDSKGGRLSWISSDPRKDEI